MKRIVIRSLLILGPLCLAAAIFIFQMAPTHAQNGSCSGDYFINETLPLGAGWEMCWEHRDQEGIVLQDIVFKLPDGSRRKVMREATIAQIHVPYDDNGLRRHYVTEDGLGAGNLMTLTAEDCPGGTLIAHEGQDVLCKTVMPRGYVYKHYGSQRQGDLMRLYSVSQIDLRTYIVQWDFYDEGVITPAMGITGELDRFGTDGQYGMPVNDAGEIGIGFVNNTYWRLDFDIADNGANDIVEEMNAMPVSSRSRKEMVIERLTTETGRLVESETKRSWRVRDAEVVNTDEHFVSYHLEPTSFGHRYIGPDYEAWTTSDVYFTVDQDCERFIAQNASDGSCGADVTEFVNGESIDGSDVVVWYGMSYHYLPRSEDDPYMPVHWDSFHLIPRDWTNTNPLAN